MILPPYTCHSFLSIFHSNNLPQNHEVMEEINLWISDHWQTLHVKLRCFLVCFLHFTLVSSVWSFMFFLYLHCHGQWPSTLKDFYPRFYPLHFCPILINERKPAFPILMLSAKQGNYWYHFYNVFDMMLSLTGDWTRNLPHSKPALFH